MTTVQHGFGPFGPQVQAPMPARGWNELDNNPPASDGVLPAQSTPTAPRPSPVSPAGRKQVMVEMTPNEKEAVMGIQRVSRRTQLFGLLAGAGAGYLIAQKRLPGAPFKRYLPPILVGSLFSPFWSVPLAYFLSKPYIKKIQDDEHFKSVLAQSERTRTSVNSIPVNPDASAALDDGSSAADGAAQQGLGGFGTESAPYASAPYTGSSAQPATTSEPEDAWARLRRGNAQASQAGHSAWDDLRKNPPSSSAPATSGEENVWGDAPSVSPAQRELDANIERERQGQGEVIW